MNIRTCVNLDELRSDLSIQLDNYAKENSLDEAAKDELIDESGYVLRSMFNALQYSHKTGRFGDYDQLEKWCHRKPSEFENDWRLLSIDRLAFQEAVSQYNQMSCMHCKKIDWFVINVLNYAEYIGFYDEVMPKIMGHSEFINTKFDYLPGKGAKPLWVKFAQKVILWAIWFAVLIFLNDGFKDVTMYAFIWFLGACVYLILSYQHNLRQKKIKSKVNSILFRMSNTYLLCDQINLSYRNLWDSMLKDKDEDVVWDNLVYTVVERRINKEV